MCVSAYIVIRLLVSPLQPQGIQASFLTQEAVAHKKEFLPTVLIFMSVSNWLQLLSSFPIMFLFTNTVCIINMHMLLCVYIFNCWWIYVICLPIYTSGLFTDTRYNILPGAGEVVLKNMSEQITRKLNKSCNMHIYLYVLYFSTIEYIFVITWSTFSP